MDEFYKRDDASDGYRNECKECIKANGRARRVADPERARKKDKEAYERNKEKKLARSKQYREENKDRTRENQRKWKKNNPDKVKANAKRYRTKNAEKIAKKNREYERNHAKRRSEWAKEWRKKNPERAKANARRTRENNRDATNARNNEYMKNRYLTDPEYRETAKKKAREDGPVWRQNNKDKTRVHGLNRRARLVNAEGSHTPEDVEAIHMAQGYVCAICGTDTKYANHVDHKTPLSRGGSNWPSNLQILCPTCNVSKWKRTEEEYAEWLSKLVVANDNKPIGNRKIS